MKLADLSPQQRAWLARARWDRIIEKYEGPWSWRWDIEHDDSSDERADFLTLGGYDVLLPVASAQHPKISALWMLPSEAKNKLSDAQKTITAGRVVAELSLGFWTSLFSAYYEKQCAAAETPNERILRLCAGL